MIKYLLSALLLLSFSFHPVCSTAQKSKPPTPEEIKQLSEQMLQRVNSGKELTEKEVEEMMNKMGGEEGIRKMANATPRKEQQPVIAKSSVTQKALIGKELTNYLAKMIANMNTRMDTAGSRMVNHLIGELDSNSAKLNQLAVYAFYKGAVAQAVLLAANGVLFDPKNDLALNNLASMLITGGAPAHALPILKGLIIRYPNNAMILNNIGQSFAAMGMKDSAMKYLDRCMKASPQHPQASSTAAKVSKASGNTKQALEYAKLAVENALDPEAAEFIAQNDRSGDAFSFLVHNNKAPDYFNLYGIKKPRHQRKIEEAAQAEAEQNAFIAEIERMTSELSQLINEEQRLGEAQLEREMKQAQQLIFATGKPPAGIMHGAWQTAIKVMTGNRSFLHDRLADMGKEGDRFNAFIKNEEAALSADIDKINRIFIEKKSHYECGEGKVKGCVMLEALTKQQCKETNDRINLYLESCAQAAEEYDRKLLLFARERFFFLAKWQTMSGPNQHLANSLYYKAASEYLTHIRKTVSYRIVEPRCQQLEKLLLKYRFIDLVKPPCPIDKEFSAGIVSLKVNCKEYDLTVDVMDEFKLNFKKDFEKAQSTLSVIHVSLDESKSINSKVAEIIGIEAGVKAEITEAAFITIGSDGRIVDLGVKASASASGNIKVDNGINNTEVKLEISGEVVWGINSGMNGTGSGLASIL